jgi:vacuolar-type H+-ATPase subunit I/STV1
MKFAKIVFLAAGVWGVVLVTPLYFIFDLIGQQDPPPITHPGFYYGFAGVALAWQVAFFIIARDPGRFRPIMIPSILEKIGYGGAMVVLYLQGRMHGQDLAFGVADLVFAALFVVAYLRIGRIAAA